MYIQCSVFLYSSGRDRVLILWDILSALPIRILPVYEEIEDTFVLSKDVSLSASFHIKTEDAIYVAAAGEKGLVMEFKLLYY